jgi:hypothetical protein
MEVRLQPGVEVRATLTAAPGLWRPADVHRTSMRTSDK